MKKFSSFLEGHYYSFQELSACGVRLHLLAIRRNKGFSYRLYRETQNESHFWMEGPFGKNGKILYLYLANTPLERSHSQQENRREKKENSKLVDRNEKGAAGLNALKSKIDWQQVYPTYYADSWKRKLFGIFLLMVGLVYFIVWSSGLITIESLLTAGVIGLFIFFTLFAFIIVPKEI